MVNLITNNIDIWTTAQTPKANGGRGSGNGSGNHSDYGIKKLRELILELAVRGKLVPQDPNDEPASVLLERIAEEKARLVKEGKIRKQESLPEIGEDEKAFELPDGWEWGRLGALGHTQTGTTPSTTKSEYFGKGYPFIKPAAILDKGVSYDGDELTESGITVGRLIPDGSALMVCIGGSIGKVGYVDRVVSCNQQINALTPFARINAAFVACWMKSPLIQKQVLSIAPQTTLPILSKGKWELLLFPLPPLVEQHRIVAKVDELMALCDQLEQQQANSNAAHQTMVETLLTALTAAANQGEFTEAWQRIAEHFDTLFTTEYSIDLLKQTLLQLAVMGKLVPQDPNDEPASVLLEKIAKEKTRLVKEGKIKKQAPLPEIGENEMPFELPRGWVFVRLLNLCKLITKGSSPNWQGIAYTDDPKDVLFITSENVDRYTLNLSNRKYVEMKFIDIEPRSVLERGDFLMNIVGASIGRTATYDIDDLANINQAVCLIRVFVEFLSAQYLLHFFNSEICVSCMFDKQVDNARANLSMGNIAKFVIPLPPLAEQHRIVAKVDELMALCDALKGRLNDAQTTQVRLADTVVEKAVS